MDTKREMNIAPVALFTLVSSLGMAVLAVLALSTSQAMWALSQRSALMTSEVYEAEVCGQRFVAGLDDALAQARERGGDVYAYVSSQLPTIVVAAQQEADPLGLAQEGEGVQVSADMVGNEVRASVVTPEARRIDIVIVVDDDFTYSISEWKATSEADSSGSADTLWMPGM